MPTADTYHNRAGLMDGSSIQHQAALTFSTATTTIAATTVYAPNAGARIKKWGLVVTTVATGTATGTMAIQPVISATTTALADAITTSVSASVTAVALGPRLGGAGSRALTAGQLIDFIQTKAGTITLTNPAYRFWVEWDS